ncbi:MAG TPA: hypothetical protein VK203_04355 [Nostocaceae cyanobacterium]|nr:hypothetical protein [Nostocaceae cyanobacterium]
MEDKTSTLQNAIEVVEALDPEEQFLLIDIIAKRLQKLRRVNLLKEMAQVESDYAQGNVKRGSVADLMLELKD